MASVLTDVSGQEHNVCVYCIFAIKPWVAALLWKSASFPIKSNSRAVSLYIVCMCVLGQRGACVSLLGFVWRPRRFRRGGRCLPPAAAPHRLPAPGRHRDPAQRDLPAAHRAGRRARWQPVPAGKHPRPSPLPDQSCFVARGCWHTGFPLQHSTTPSLLYWEEDPARMPGDWSHRERLQRNG